MPSSPEPVHLLDLRAGDRPVRQTPLLFELGGDDSVESARAAAQAAGYAAGWANGIRDARASALAEVEHTREASARFEAERAAGLRRAFTAVDAAATALERRAVPMVSDHADLILSTAYAIAEALIGHDLRTNPDRAPDTLARALALAPVGEPVTVRLSPADHAALATSDAPTAGRDVRLVADPTLQPGDAIAVCGATQIDARIAAGLARVREVLS